MVLNSVYHKNYFYLAGKANETELHLAAGASNLSLAQKIVVVGGGKNSSDWPKTPWAAIEAARQMIVEKPESFVVVAPTGIAPVFAP